MFSFNDILKQIDPLANDEVSREFLRIAGADPALMRELALQTIQQQWPFTASMPAPAAPPSFAAPAAALAQQKPTYRQLLEQALLQVPGFTPPPAPQAIPAPPPVPVPPKPEPIQLPSPPMPPEPPAQWKPADFVPGLFAAMFNQDALPYVAGAIEQGLQAREQRAQNRYERAISNALRQWQVRLQEALLNQQAQQQWQQQAYQAQLQNQQAQYQAQLQNIQQQNQYAQQRWAAEQDYNQWQWGQKLGALGKLAEQEAREEEKQLQRELQEQLRTDQLAMQSFNILMGYVGKPTLSATERQAAVGLADSLAQQFPRFAPMFVGMKQSIQAKPSVPELNLERMQKETEARIATMRERLAQGWANVRLRQQRLSQSVGPAGAKPADLQKLVSNARADLNATRQDIRHLRNMLQDYDAYMAMSSDSKVAMFFKQKGEQLRQQLSQLEQLASQQEQVLRDAQARLQATVTGPKQPQQPQQSQQPQWRDLGGGIKVRVK